MKIILAGFPKTGTKTLSHALRSLEYSVYDYEENFWYLGRDWARIMKHGPESGDFYRMYKDIDACADLPPSFFWEDILKEFPEAKVILSVRDSEDIWFKSLMHQSAQLKGFLFTWITLLSPTALRHFMYFNLLGYNAFGYPGIFPWTRLTPTPLLQKLAYRRHNCSVKQNTPEGQLLIYNVKEGWEPLCEFLGIDVPEIPFPHQNKGGEIAEEIALTSPVFQRIKTEFLVSLTLIVGLTGFALYKITTR